MTAEERGRVWCAARAEVHVGLAIDQIADLIFCVDRLEDGLSESCRTAARSLWAVRERIFAILEKQEEDEEGDGDES